MNKLAFWGVFIIPIIWGLGYPLTHNAVAILNPGVFVFYRMVVATFCLLPFALWSFKKINRRVIIGGLLMGACNTMGIVNQGYALLTISSEMTAFFVTLNIIFVPFLALIFRVTKFRWIDFVVVLLGVISILISFNGYITGVSIGNLYGLLAAFSFAMYIIVVQIMTKKQATDSLLLSFFSVMFGAIFLSYFPIHYPHQVGFSNVTVWGAFVYQGAICGALAVLLQMLFQKRVGPTRTAVILNLDLVFAGLFGLANGELLTLSQIIGGVIALFASFFQDLFPFLKRLFGK